MKQYFIIFLTFFIFGCSGGGDNTPPSSPPPEPPVTPPVTPPSGAVSLPLLIIQVEFNDTTFTSSTLTWQEKIFGSAVGQLNHYYLEVSQNKFLFIPANEGESSVNDGIIKVRVNQNHIQTLGTNFNNYTAFANVLFEALTLADPYINFAAYDTNKNAAIDVNELQIMFLVAGGEEATGVNPGIWAHQSCINGVSLDGKALMQCGNGTYTAFGEHHFSSNGPDAGIGIIAHELGHGVFNLPDLYDRDLSSEGIGNFGLMGAGSWGFQAGQIPGYTPAHMSAWTKMQIGFSTPALITSSTANLALDATHLQSYQALRLNTQDPNEYFLVENRSSLGYDAGLYILDEAPFQGGLAIWHIDETQGHNDNENQKLVDLEEADGFLLDNVLFPPNQGDQSNLFYAGNNATPYTGTFTHNSTPSNSDLYSGADTNISITNISAPGTVMYLDLSF